MYWAGLIYIQLHYQPDVTITHVYWAGLPYIPQDYQLDVQGIPHITQ